MAGGVWKSKLNWLCFVLLFSCARELKKESDLTIGSEEFNQQIQSVNNETLDKIVVHGSDSRPVEKNETLEAQKAKVSFEVPGDKKPSPKDKKPQPKAEVKKTDSEKVWQPNRWPFGVGEKITWALKYGPIEAGEATLEVQEPKVIAGEPVLQYTGRVKSTRLMEYIYKVNDTMHTWTGLYDHLPRRQEINQLESGRWGKRVVVFDTKQNQAKFYSFTNFPDGRSEEVKRVDTISKYAQDVLGALYFVRFLDPLEYTNFPIHDRWKNWANELTYLGEKTIRVPAGTYKTHHYKMLPRVSGQLEPRGDVEIWVWDHPSRLMVQFAANVRVGSVVGELRNYTEGKPFAIPPPAFKTPKIVESAAAR
jgi:hypothetical protein